MDKKLLKDLKEIQKEMLKTFQKPRKIDKYYDVVKGKAIYFKESKKNATQESSQGRNEEAEAESN